MAKSTVISQEVQALHRRVETVQRALAEVSHEIRTQLAGILGLAQVALQTSSPSEQFEYLGLIHTTGEELLTLVNDVLDLSKVEAGQLRMERIPFGLGDCVRDAIATLAPATPAVPTWGVGLAALLLAALGGAGVLARGRTARTG